ncbi:MAG: hypothetical protein ACJZ8M_04360, partial [Pseudohongiellaceae bacterium]
MNDKSIQFTGRKGILALPSAMFDGGDIDTKLVSELSAINNRWYSLFRFVYENKEKVYAKTPAEKREQLFAQLFTNNDLRVKWTDFEGDESQLCALVRDWTVSQSQQLKDYENEEEDDEKIFYYVDKGKESKKFLYLYGETLDKFCLSSKNRLSLDPKVASLYIWAYADASNSKGHQFNGSSVHELLNDWLTQESSEEYIVQVKNYFTPTGSGMYEDSLAPTSPSTKNRSGKSNLASKKVSAADVEELKVSTKTDPSPTSSSSGSKFADSQAKWDGFLQEYESLSARRQEILGGVDKRNEDKDSWDQIATIREKASDLLEEKDRLDAKVENSINEFEVSINKTFKFSPLADSFNVVISKSEESDQKEQLLFVRSELPKIDTIVEQLTKISNIAERAGESSFSSVISKYPTDHNNLTTVEEALNDVLEKLADFEYVEDIKLQIKEKAELSVESFDQLIDEISLDITGLRKGLYSMPSPLWGYLASQILLKEEKANSDFIILVERFVDSRGLDGLLALAQLNRRDLESLYQNETLKPYIELLFSTLILATSSRHVSAATDLRYSQVIDSQKSIGLKLPSDKKTPEKVIQGIASYVKENRGTSLFRIAGMFKAHQDSIADVNDSGSTTMKKSPSKVELPRIDENEYLSEAKKAIRKSMIHTIIDDINSFKIESGLGKISEIREELDIRGKVKSHVEDDLLEFELDHLLKFLYSELGIIDFELGRGMNDESDFMLPDLLAGASVNKESENLSRTLYSWSEALSRQDYSKLPLDDASFSSANSSFFITIDGKPQLDFYKSVMAYSSSNAYTHKDFLIDVLEKWCSSEKDIQNLEDDITLGYRLTKLVLAESAELFESSEIETGLLNDKKAAFHEKKSLWRNKARSLPLEEQNNVLEQIREIDSKFAEDRWIAVFTEQAAIESIVEEELKSFGSAEERQKLEEDISSLGGQAQANESLDSLRKLRNILWDGTENKRIHTQSLKSLLKFVQTDKNLRQEVKSCIESLESPAWLPTESFSKALNLIIKPFGELLAMQQADIYEPKIRLNARIIATKIARVMSDRKLEDEEDERYNWLFNIAAEAENLTDVKTGGLEKSTEIDDSVTKYCLDNNIHISDIDTVEMSSEMHTDSLKGGPWDDPIRADLLCNLAKNCLSGAEKKRSSIDIADLLNSARWEDSLKHVASLFSDGWINNPLDDRTKGKICDILLLEAICRPGNFDQEELQTILDSVENSVNSQFSRSL